jgi:hypothetical protein
VAHHRLFIDGTWVNSSLHSTIKDIDPSTGKLYAWVEQAGMDETEQAIATAHRASKTWGSSLAAEREAVLAQAANVLIARTDEIREGLIDSCRFDFDRSLCESRRFPERSDRSAAFQPLAPRGLLLLGGQNQFEGGS